MWKKKNRKSDIILPCLWTMDQKTIPPSLPLSGSKRKMWNQIIYFIAKTLKNVGSIQIQKIRSIKINFGLGKQGLSLSCHVSEPWAKRLSPRSLPRSGVPKRFWVQKVTKRWKPSPKSYLCLKNENIWSLSEFSASSPNPPPIKENKNQK